MSDDKEDTMKKILGIGIMMLGILAGAFSDEMKQSTQAMVESRVIEGDYFYTGKSLNFEGKSKNLFSATEDLIMKGEILHSLHSASKRIRIDGNVGDGIMAAAEIFDINRQVSGTVFAAAKSLSFSPESTVNGTVFAASETATLDGTVNGPVFIAAGTWILNGTINGNVKTGAGRIIFGEKARINGDLIYHTDHELSDADRKKISGSATFKLIKSDRWQDMKERRKVMQGTHAGMKVFGLISMLIAGLLLMLFPGLKSFNERVNPSDFRRSSLYGLLPFFLYPVLVVVSLIVFPVAFILGLAGLPILLLTQIFGLTLIGNLLFQAFRWKKENRFLYFLTAFGIYSVITWIPVVNFAVMVSASAAGWGYILNYLFNMKKEQKEPVI
jgi:cytoskeletal protein CcmA (bactofilin family)